MSTDTVHNVIIIGSGPAGYTAAIYTARAGLKPLMLAGTKYGGQLMLTSDVENFPGYPKSVSGPDLMQDLHVQADRFGAKIEPLDCVSVSTTSTPFVITTSDNKSLKTRSIIIATGAQARWLNAPGEDVLRGKGISTCATCDGPMCGGVPVVVVGGGDSAMEEALFLTRFASKVTLVHRRDVFRASQIMLKRVREHPKITVMTNTVVKEWQSDESGLIGAVLSTTTNESVVDETVACKGAFIAIGHVPSTEFIGSQVETDESGYIVQSKHTMTSVNGVFACGDVVDTRYRQAITAAGMGCQAALDCERWLDESNE